MGCGGNTEAGGRRHSQTKDRLPGTGQLTFHSEPIPPPFTLDQKPCAHVCGHNQCFSQGQKVSWNPTPKRSGLTSSGPCHPATPTYHSQRCIHPVAASAYPFYRMDHAGAGEIPLDVTVDTKRCQIFHRSFVKDTRKCKLYVHTQVRSLATIIHTTPCI